MSDKLSVIFKAILKAKNNLKAADIFFALVFVVLIVLGFWLRLNSAFETAPYNGDEGRDYLFGYRIWHGDLTLIGPAISTVRFFLPPTWYYIVSLPLKLGGWRTEAPLIFMICLGTLAVFFYYKIGKLLSGERAGGLLMAALYLLSPFAFEASRMTGNHVLIPIVAGAYFWLVLRFLNHRKRLDLFWASFILGLTFSLHFSVLPLIIIHWLLALLTARGRKLASIVAEMTIHTVLLLVWWSPILIFDLRNQFVNFRGFWWYLTQGNVDELRTFVGQGAWSLGNNFLVAKSFFVGKIGVVIGQIWLFHLLLVSGLLIFWRKKAGFEKRVSISFLVVVLACFFVSFLFYKGYSAPHYFYIILPIYYSLITVSLWPLAKHLQLICLLILCMIPYQFLSPSAYVNSQKRVLLVKGASRAIINDVKQLDENKRYSIFLKKDEDFWSLAYEYKYLVESQTGKRVLDPNQYSQADFLYVVAEIPVDNPLTIGNWEVTSFGPKTIDWQTSFGSYQVFRLSR